MPDPIPDSELRILAEHAKGVSTVVGSEGTGTISTGAEVVSIRVDRLARELIACREAMKVECQMNRVLWSLVKNARAGGWLFPRSLLHDLDVALEASDRAGLKHGVSHLLPAREGEPAPLPPCQHGNEYRSLCPDCAQDDPPPRRGED